MPSITLEFSTAMFSHPSHLSLQQGQVPYSIPAYLVHETNFGSSCQHTRHASHIVAASRRSTEQQQQRVSKQTAAINGSSVRQGTRLIQRQVQQSLQPGQQQLVLQDVQPVQPQQQQQLQRGYYLTGSDADQWTWDDDYNPAVRAKAAAAAKQLPPTPRQQALAQQAAAAAQQRPTVITRLPEHFNRQVLSNGVLLIDKPTRWSSADVARQLKVALKLDKVGVGGPLDAHATGLLIVLMGAATRLTPKLEPLERTYTGTLKLGATTTTYDATGQVVQSNPWQHISDEDIVAAAARFQGEVLQVPCMWSSTKYKNRPLRWYAERGEEVVREPKAVQISSIEVWRDRGTAGGSTGSSSRGGSSSSRRGSSGPADEVHFRVIASKGASMRVLADDIGKALGCGAHLASLRREAIGGFKVDTAWSLEVLLPLAKKYAKGFQFGQMP